MRNDITQHRTAISFLNYGKKSKAMNVNQVKCLRLELKNQVTTSINKADGGPENRDPKSVQKILGVIKTLLAMSYPGQIIIE